MDGQEYRWRVRRQPSRGQEDFGEPLTFSVQRADEPGAILIVEAAGTRLDTWLDEQAPPVTPALVSHCVRRALAQGWRPDRPGQPFLLYLEAGAEPAA